MKKELDQLSVTLSRKHFDAAMELNNQLKATGVEESPIEVSTSEVYKKSFTFPQIAQNDFAVEQFDSLKDLEKVLKREPTLESFEAFVKKADEVAHNLKEHYADQWIDPNDDRAVAEI